MRDHFYQALERARTSCVKEWLQNRGFMPVKTETYSAGGLAVEVQTYNDGSFRLKQGSALSKVFRADEIGFLQSDGVTFFFGHNEQTGLLPGVPYLGVPSTVC